MPSRIEMVWSKQKGIFERNLTEKVFYLVVFTCGGIVGGSDLRKKRQINYALVRMASEFQR